MHALPHPDAARLPSSQWQTLEQALDALPSQAPAMPQRWHGNRTANGRKLVLPPDDDSTQPMGLTHAVRAAQAATTALQFREAMDGLQVRELDSQALFDHFFGNRSA